MMKIRSAALLLAVIGFSAAVPARADFVATATLSGANEVPPHPGLPSTGFITVTYEAANADLLYSVTFSGLAASATAAHLHVGPPGIAGPIFLPFTNMGPPPATSGTFSGTLTAANLINQGTTGITTIAQAAALIQAGGVYANIHDATFPGGEIRGQLSVVPEPGSILLMLLGAAGAILVRRRTTGRRLPAA